MRLAKMAAILLVVLSVSASAARAQTASGKVNGTVTDKSGTAVSDAAVKLTNEGTRITKRQ
jgi:hypothetical protein